MTIETLIEYIIKKNLTSQNRKLYYIYNRTLIYAYMHYELKMNLTNIAKIFETDHSRVLYHLKKAHYVQNYLQFAIETEELQNQLKFIIPEYKSKTKKTDKSSIKVSITLEKKHFEQWIRKENPEVIYDFLWGLMIRNAKRKSLSK